MARAEAASAELALAERQLEEQRAKVTLARAMQVPDITPEAAVTQNNEPEFDTGWRAAVAIGVPLFTRHRAGVRLEEATLTQLQSERDATRVRIGGEVASAAALAQSSLEQYLRYRDQILPQALEVERMAEDSYVSGRPGLPRSSRRCRPRVTCGCGLAGRRGFPAGARRPRARNRSATSMTDHTSRSVLVATFSRPWPPAGAARPKKSKRKRSFPCR